VRRANNNAIWDTDGGTFYWALGASLGLDTPLLNAGNGAVNLAVTEGQAVYMFVSDFSPTPFSGGNAFTVTVGFADGATSTATTTMGP
jgi:hypothetical protein